MGTENRKETAYYGNAKAPSAPKIYPSSLMARNLTKNQLGGVIFGCKNNTIKECLFKQLFGLPAPHFSYIKNVYPGLPLFLFNYSDRKLHGIFEAASSGQMNINPYGWTIDGAERTQFPAQVQVHVRKQCIPLHESQFKPIIADNYYNDHHFWFEVDHAQAKKLIALLASSAVHPGTSVTPNTVKWRNMFGAVPLRETREESKERSSPDLEPDQKSDSTGALSSSDGERHALETEFDATLVPQEEKDKIFMKLKELALKNEVINSKRQDMAISGDDAQGKDKIYPKEQITGSVQNTAPTNDTQKQGDDDVIPYVPLSAPLNGCSRKQLGQENHCEQTPVPSLDISLITRLLQEVEELKIFKTDQTQKVGMLEEKLVRAESEVQLLKRQLKLESEANPSIVTSDEEAVKSFDELDLDPKDSILLLGGYDGESWLSTFDSYYPQVNVLNSVRPMNYVRPHASVTQLNGELYVIGGGNSHVWYDTVESYSPARNQWTLYPSLRQERRNLAGASIHNKIFAIGGENGSECFSNVEMLDLDMGRWIQTRSMQQQRFSLAAAVLNGVIYATGGFDGEDYLKSVEMFDPREHSWTNISRMNSKRGCHSLVVLNEKLYAVGGFDGNTMVPTVEVFDPRLGSWMSGEPMNHPRGYFGAAVVNDTIYAIGGLREENSIVNEVESFKEGKSWEEIKGCSISKRAFHSAVALSP